MVDKVVEADVLIIGGGLAGTWAAIRARDFVDNVVLVDKSKVSRSGPSSANAGVILFPTENDDLDAWQKEIVEGGEYMNDQEWVALMLQGLIGRLKELEEWGVPFERDDNGKIKRIVGRAHKITRLAMFHHGMAMMEVMRRKLLEKGVTLMERIMITDLLTSDGEHPTEGNVIGAIGFNYRTEETVLFKAKAVVQAAGPLFLKKGAHFTDNDTGDGISMSFRAGAEAIDMEFVIGGAHGAWNRSYYATGFNMYAGHGLRFVNAKGEAFMAKYDPVLADRAPQHILALAFLKEVFEGRGPIYADGSQLTQETIDTFRRVIPHAMMIHDRAGVDLLRDRPEFSPDAGLNSETGEGGLKINLYCEMCVQGLYGAGSVCKNLVGGTFESVGGLPLAYCSVTGYRAGEYAAKYAQVSRQEDVIQSQVEALQQIALAPLALKEGFTSDQLSEDLREITRPPEAIFIKSERRLQKTLEEIRSIKANLPQVKAADYHELVKANEIRNTILACEIAWVAALERKESRFRHFREDFPDRDDAHWLKRIVLRQEGDRIATRFEPIPVYRYPVRPGKFEKTPAPIQIFLERGGE